MNGQRKVTVSGNDDEKSVRVKNENGITNGGTPKLQKFSAVSATGKPITIAVSPSPLRKQLTTPKKGNPKAGKNKKQKSKRKRKLSGGAIFLSFLLALAAIASSAWLITEVRRIDKKLMGLITDLEGKAEVVADSLLKDCVYARPWDKIHGVTRIFPVPYPRGSDVYCDQVTDGGGWTIIQRRANGSVDFNRNWSTYKRGFGSVYGEVWMGLQWIHQITTNSGAGYELRIDFEDFEGGSAYAKYRKFRVGDAAAGYTLHVSGYNGTAGDALKYHNQMKFSTYDRDNDLDKGKSCAAYHHGAWWYNACHSSNLNGKYRRGRHKSYADGVNWRFWKGDHYSLKLVEMKIRRKV